jgi:predicted amidohydrolase YtcJ
MTRFTLIPLLIASLLLVPCFAEAPAERVFRNGKIYTADPHGTLVQAIAIRDGRIVYVGTNEGVALFIAASTNVTDLQGRFLMPGLIDGHMHPLEGGLVLRKCSLNYEPLTVPQMQQRVQACLDKTKSQERMAGSKSLAGFRRACVRAA